MKPRPAWTPDALATELDRLVAEVPEDALPEALGALEASREAYNEAFPVAATDSS